MCVSPFSECQANIFIYQKATVFHQILFFFLVTWFVIPTTENTILETQLVKTCIHAKYQKKNNWFYCYDLLQKCHRGKGFKILYDY